MSIFFLMCSERSGSNLITKILNAHTDVCGPSTKHIINPVARNLFRYKDLNNEDNWLELLKDIENLFNVDFSIWKTKFDLEKFKQLAPKGDIASLIKNLYLAEAKENNKIHVFVKENHLYEFISFLLLNFPESKYVYLVRDPRDMALSWKKNPTHRGGVVAAANQWKKDQMNFSKDHSFLMLQNKSRLIKYEDLISNFEKEVKEICKFLGIMYQPKMLDFHKDELTVQNAQKQAAWGNLSKGIMSENKEKYQKELSIEEIQIIEKICYPEMVALNYSPLYAESELISINAEFIYKFNENEVANKYQQLKLDNNPVSANMEAKKIFYQKIIQD